MIETLSNQPEREPTEEEMKRAEATNVAEIVGYLYKGTRGTMTAEEVGDLALHEIHFLCASLAKRDPELGAYLVEALESHEVASTELDPAEQIRKIIGMPVPDYVALNHAEQEARDRAWTESHPTTPPPEHNQ
jgi:hypothetical protein